MSDSGVIAGFGHDHAMYKVILAKRSEITVVDGVRNTVRLV